VARSWRSRRRPETPILSACFASGDVASSSGIRHERANNGGVERFEDHDVGGRATVRPSARCRPLRAPLGIAGRCAPERLVRRADGPSADRRLLGKWSSACRAKDLRDLAASLLDGRLFPRGARLAHSPYGSLFLIEGPTPSSLPDVHHHSVEGALVSIAAMWRIPVWCAAAAVGHECGRQIRPPHRWCRPTPRRNRPLPGRCRPTRPSQNRPPGRRSRSPFIRARRSPLAPVLPFT
jgi:hypothetical protein